MKRFRLRSFGKLTWPSLLLFMALAAMWARSFLYGDAVDWTRGTAVLEIRSGAGYIAFQREMNLGLNYPQGSFNRFHRWLIAYPQRYDVAKFGEEQGFGLTWDDTRFWDRYIVSHKEFRFCGFAVFWVSWTYKHEFWAVETPYWFWLLVIAAVPGLPVMMRRRARRNRLKRGLCTTCGYDLRATPDRCPECGTVPMKKVVMV